MVQFWTTGPQNQLWKGLQECINSELAEEFLQTLLSIMALVFTFNRDYGKKYQKLQWAIPV